MGTTEDFNNPEIDQDKLPEVVKQELKTEQQMRQIMEMNATDLLSELFKQDRINILITPPRFFPSKEWFGFALNFDIMIPYLNCYVPLDWFNIKLHNHTLKGLPVSGDYIDAMKWSEEKMSRRTDIGRYPDFNKFVRFWKRRIKQHLSKYKYTDEAIEILTTQLNLSLTEHYNQNSPIDNSEFEEFPRYTAVISNLLTKSINRIGTAIVPELKLWPLQFWPNMVSTKIETENSIETYRYHESPVNCKTIGDIINAIIKPAYYFIRQSYKCDINICLDMACFGGSGIMFWKNVPDTFEANGDLQVNSEPITSFNQYSILNDIAEFSLDDMYSICLKSIKDTPLELKIFNEKK